MIVLVGGEKGGTGKTTLAIHLAASRTSAPAAMSCSSTPTSKAAQVHGVGKGLGADIRAMAAKYADLVIDAGGRDSVELRAAMTVADVLCIPIQASQFDVWTLDQMNILVEQATAINDRLRAFAVLNRASTNPSVKEAEDARSALAEYEHLQPSAVVIRDRISFRKAAREGCTVSELPERDVKAIGEIDALCEEVFRG